MKSKPAIENDFFKEGCKSTKQRQGIIKILGDADKPLSAEEIFMYIKSMHPSLALSTVYRNLEIMLEKALVRKEIYNDGKARYQLVDREHKHHLFCIKCNKVIALDECPVKAFETKLRDEMDFEVSGHDLVIYGKCSECKNK